MFIFQRHLNERHFYKAKNHFINATHSTECFRELDMDDNESSPRENEVNRNIGDISLNDIREACTCVLGLESTHKVLFICVCACLLTCLTLQTGTQSTSPTDVFVYCAVYSSWVTLCLPWLVQNMNGKIIQLVLGVFFRLFGADLGVLAWKILRGHSHIFHRGLRMRPLFESSMSWLSDAGYNLRYAVIVAAIIASTMSFIIRLYRQCFPSGVRLSSNSTSTDLNYEDSLTSKAESSGTVPHSRETGESSCFREPMIPRAPPVFRPQTPGLTRRGSARESLAQPVFPAEALAPTATYEKGILRQGNFDRFHFNDSVSDCVDRSGRHPVDLSCLHGNTIAPVNLSMVVTKPNQGGMPGIRYGPMEMEEKIVNPNHLQQFDQLTDIHPNVQFVIGESDLSKRQLGTQRIEVSGMDYDPGHELNSVNNHLPARQFDRGGADYQARLRSETYSGNTGVREFYHGAPRDRNSGGGVLAGTSVAYSNAAQSMLDGHGTGMSVGPHGSDFCGDGRGPMKELSHRDFEMFPQTLQNAKRTLYNIKGAINGE